MSDSEDEIHIFPEDRIIIKNIEKNSFLYDPQGYIGVPGDLYENKILIYKNIAAKILRYCDKEYSWQEVKKRWNPIRHSYARALRHNKNYYLQDNLKFLKPYIKTKPTTQPTFKYTPLNLSPVSIVSDVQLSEEEEGALFDKIRQKMKDEKEEYSNGNKEIEKAIAQKKLFPIESTNNGTSHTYFKNVRVEKNNNDDCATNSALLYFQELQEDLRNIPENLLVSCIAEIFEAAKKYVLD